MRLIDAAMAPIYLNESACDQIKMMPTIDAVPVVRCKDCTYYRDSNHIDHGCSSVYGITEPDDNDFCSYGQRKEDAHEVSE